jgi:RNA polymerase sigma-70 factor (ECF subfamily)
MRPATLWGLKLTRYSSISADGLIRVCVDSKDSDAWAEFVSRFHRAIGLSIIRTAHQWGEGRRQEVDDLVQETYVKLCADGFRLLLDFSSAHPEAVLGYIKTIAVNVAHDHFKSLHSQKRGAGRIHDSLDDLEPKAEFAGLSSHNATERQVLMQEIDDCLAICSAGPDQERDRLVFWLYYKQGMSAKAIAALPTVGLTAKGVESAILRLTRQVRQQLANARTGQSGQTGEKGFRPAESY